MLVTEKDGMAIPKVIDFGIAKALNQSSLGRSVYTQFKQIMGTPLYMSPEQTGESAVDVDTRSDVYSLGVLLYELLAGTTPFTEQELKRAGDAEMLRIIRETIPSRPSTKINTLGDSASTVSENRRTEYSKLSRTVHGDLDWIVMKALEKERARRYESASAFAADVQRYLGNEPIEARPPSRVYRLRKTAIRHRTALAVTTIVMCALVASTATSMRFARNTIVANQKLSLVLDDYRTELIGRALIEMTNRDEVRARSAIEKVESIETSADVLEMLRGQLACYLGRTDEAVKHMERASRVQHPCVAAQAILATLYVTGGYDRRYMAAMEELSDSDPVTAYDYLFLGQAWIYGDPQRALEYIDTAIDMHDSAFARAVRAEAIVYLAVVDKSDDHQLLRSAIDEIRVATAFLPNHPYVAGIDLYSHVEMMRVSRDAGDLKRLQAEAEAAATCLEGFPEMSTSHMVRMIYFDYLGNDDAALKEASAAVASGGRGYVLLNCAALAYEHGEYETAMKWMASDPERESDVLAAFHAELLALSSAPGDRERARELYRQLSSPSRRSAWADRNTRLVVPEAILLLLGQYDEAKERCKERLRLSDYRTGWEEKILKYIAGTIDEDCFASVGH